MIDQAQFGELKTSGKLPSPKGSALKVIELCQRDNVTLPEIIQVVQVDPTTVGRLLKLANSAAYSRPRPAVALTPDVLMSIGIQSVRQTVLAFSLVSGNRQGQCPSFDYDAFWSRSTATAVATQLLGAATRAAPPAELFTVGSMANIGQLALAAVHPVRYGELLEQAGGQFSSALTALENSAFGYDHLDVAAAMMQDWGLPKLFSDTVLCHETPLLDDLDAESRRARLILCLHLGRQMADLCFLPPGERRAAFMKLLPMAHRLADTDLVALGDQMLSEWREWGGLLKITVAKVEAFSALAASLDAKTAEQGPDTLTILVVDNDPTVCLLLKKLLTSLGHSVHVARDGGDGLAQALLLKPQLVITDLLMPNQDGRQLITSLRQSPLGASLYILVLSLLDDELTATEAIALGADEVIAKPVDGKLLRESLLACMRSLREKELARQEQEELRRRLQELAKTTLHAQGSADCDALTGLYHRHHGMERLAQIWGEALRSRQPLAALKLEIDGFQALCAQYGDSAGDALLCQFAQILRAFSRIPDLPCRLAGHEFLLILPDIALEGALHLAERIRSAVKHQEWMAAGQAIHLTVSIGAAERTAAQADGDQLLKAATDALGNAKKGGTSALPGLEMPPGALPAIPGFDVAAALARIDGDVEEYLSFLEMFRDMSGAGITGIAAAMKLGDAEKARMLAHSLKGSSGTVGAVKLQAAAAALEKALKDTRLDSGLLDAVEAEWQQTLQSMALLLA